MNYEFPRINNISQVLEAIKGDEDLFYVVAKEGYTVVNYKISCNKTFSAVTDRDTAIRRELRGIKFCSTTGEILARPYQKFFNSGEREETLLSNIDVTTDHVRLEKLDGSMIHPIKVKGYIRWCTKMGITDTSMLAENFIMENNYHNTINFAAFCAETGFTPIFEFCSNKNRIVVSYPRDRLVLTAMRHNISGQYVPYKGLIFIANEYGLEVVRTIDEPITSIEQYVNQIHDKQGELDEGEVLRFSTGHMVKVKRKDYVNLHKTKEKIQRERNFVAVLLGQNLDDLKPFMIEDDLKRAEIYETKLNQNINELVRQIGDETQNILINRVSRKDFALGSKSNQFVKSVIFHLWDKNFPLGEIYDEVVNRLKDSCEHEQRFEKLKPIFLEGCVW